MRKLFAYSHGFFTRKLFAYSYKISFVKIIFI